MVQTKTQREIAQLKSLMRNQRISTPKRQQPKKKKKSNKRSNVRMVSGSLAAELAGSWVDPWSRSACIPDGSNGTGCFSIKQTVSLRTGAGGSCGGIFLTPFYNSMYYADNNNTTAVPVLAGNLSSADQTTTITSLFGKYRPISLGIRACYNGNTQTDQGEIIVAQFAGGVTPASFAGKTIAQVAAQAQNYKIFPLREGGQITWSPSDVDDVSQFYTTSNGAIGVAATFTTPYLAMYVFDAAASQGLLLAELIINCEGQYANQAFLTGGMNLAQRPAEPGWYEKAKNMIRGLEFIKPFVRSIADAALRNSGPVLGSLANGFLSPGVFDSSKPRSFPQLGWR